MATNRQYYLCEICECYHPADWDGDCRDNSARFAIDELDEKFGPDGWEEVDMPVGGNEPSRFVPSAKD